MATTTTSSSGNTGSGADKDTRWYFTAEQLANSPSRRQGIDADQELSFRQLTAYLIQEMGQRLQVSQLCINTAIVYMHRFYAFHSFTHFHRNGIAAASLFLAAKVEEQPRKLEHVIKVAHICLNQEPPHPSTKMYAEQAQDLVFNENVLLQTLGFDVAIDHPHTHVVKTCHLVKACKDLAQTSYFLASNSLHLTSMCLQYRPTVVACFCIYLACKWSRWEIPQSTEGKHWFHYVDKTVTMDLLQQLTDEFIIIYEKSPARLKSKLNSIKALAQSARIPEPSRADSANGSNASQLEQLTPIQTQPSSSSRRDPSSHHRPHHSSTSHHHHSKHAPPPVDPGDHKHKPPFPTSSSSSHSNRPRTDRTQNSTTTSIVNDSSQYPIAKQSSTRPSTGSNRPQQIIPPSSSQTAPVQPIVTQSLVAANVSGGQRLIHGHEQSGSQHHKSRSSSNNSNNNAPQLNPLINSSINHNKVISTKSSSEQLNRSNTIVRDATNKFQIPSSKHGSGNVSNNNSGISNASMYPPAATSVHQNHSGSSNVLDIRNMLSQQQQQNPQTTVTSSQSRSFIQNSQTIPNYQQQQQLTLGSRGNNNNSNNSNKYDQSVQQPLLVHMQQQQQQQHHQQQQHQLNQKQQQSLESSSLISPFNISNDPTSGGGGGLIKNIGAGDQMDICSPPKYSTSHQPTFIQNSQQQQQPQQNSTSNKSFSSIFSPDWNDKQNNNPIVNQNNINNIGNNNSNNKLSLNFNTKTNRDSPKKSDKEKRSGTPKKDKRNNNNIIIDQQQQQQRNSKQITSGGIQQHQVQQQNLNYIPQQTHALNFSSGTKRPLPSNDNNNSNNNNINNINIKLEEELMRETKVRKLEPIDIKPPPYLFDQSSSIQNMGNISNNNSNSSFHYQQQQQQQDIKSKQQFNTGNVVNGSIETNPDLVSSLLKESLCNENKFSSHISTTEPIIKTESIPSSIIKTESSPLLLMNPNELTLALPQQLLQDSPPPSQSITALSMNVKQDTLISCNSVTGGGGGGGASSNDEYSKTKTEKKKKKDKHKHKEKDKTKDKEERKKHKKDKDKHKERDRTNSGIGGVTGTIGNMDSVELLTNEQNNPVKIKISKDKLNLPSLIDSSGNSIVGSGGAINSGQFKIKIPKDRIKGEMNAFSNNDDNTVTGGIGMGGQNYQNQTVPQVNSLKIKFFKDKGENYSQDNSSFHGNSSIGGGGGHGNNISGSGISSSGSSKKKDRDRDRDKEKKRNSSDKQNGGNNGGSGSTTTATKTQSNSSKIHSQLFGESNDDDDDFDDVPMTTLNSNQFNNKQQYKSTSLSSSNHLYSYQQQQQQQQSRSSGNSGGGGYSYSDIKKYNNNNSSSSSQQQQQQQHQYQQNYK